MMLVTLERAKLPPLRLNVAYVEDIHPSGIVNDEAVRYTVVTRNGRTYHLTPEEAKPLLTLWDKMHASLLRQMENETE